MGLRIERARPEAKCKHCRHHSDCQLLKHLDAGARLFNDITVMKPRVRLCVAECDRYAAFERI